MKAGELCAGYGGLALAVEEVFGADTAWFSEFDPAPSKILAHHWPNVPNHGDMTKINWANIEPVDIISGGTPCQDLSHAGRRKGMTDGTRSNLWVQMREAIATIQPRYVVWENVRGAYSAKADSEMEHCPRCMGDTRDERVVLRALGRVLGDLSDLGFDAEWRGLRAADVGACHPRFRVFVLARRRPVRDTISQDVEGQRPRRLQIPRVADEPRERRSAGTHSSDATLWGWDVPRSKATREGHHQVGGCHSGESTPNPESVGWREGRAEPEGIERRPNTSLGSGPSWGEYAPAIRRWESVMGRRAPAPTELNDKGNHRLSPSFTEWMMGLPDGWVTDPAIGISRNEQLKACGNGVVPQQAIAALRDMRATFEAREEEAA